MGYLVWLQMYFKLSKYWFSTKLPTVLNCLSNFYTNKVFYYMVTHNCLSKIQPSSYNWPLLHYVLLSVHMCGCSAYSIVEHGIINAKRRWSLSVIANRLDTIIIRITLSSCRPLEFTTSHGWTKTYSCVHIIISQVYKEFNWHH